MSIKRVSDLRQAQLAVLDLVASCTGCAIGLWDASSGKDIEELVSRGQFESYCQKVQSLPGGKRRCHNDHVERAKWVIENGEPALTLCYAGVFNQALPIIVDDRVRAVLMYGQMWIEEDCRCVEAKKRLEGVIRRLDLEEDDELELRVCYDEIKRMSREDLDLLNEQLFLLQCMFYGMLSEQQERDKQTEGIIHDLQTRLQPVLALAENLYYALCRMPDGCQQLKESQVVADELLKSAQAMRVLVRNLGEFMPEYQFESCSLTKIVKEAITLYGAEAERKKIAVRDWLEEPSKVEASPVHLQQAINNLLHNALKYSFRGAHDRRRFVDIRGGMDGSNYVLTLSNYGVGILPEEYDLIFKPGYKGRLTHKEYRSGSGMGLAITKEIIEKHHGTIKVKSEKTEGEAYVNKFVVRLPKWQTEEEEKDENRLD